MIIIAIANAKGGTAKTTTAVALAAEAAYRGERTLLIDLDTQRNSTTHLLGKEGGDDGKAVYRAVLDGDPLEVFQASAPGLSVASAGRRTQDLADALERMVRDAAPEDLGAAYRAVRTTVHSACGGFDVVVVDTPPSKQSATLLDFVFASATHAIFPTKIDENSTSAVSDALTALVKLARRGATVADPLGILLVDVDTAATRLTEAALAQVEHVGRIVEPFKSIVGHRSGPVSYARAAGLTPRQFHAAAIEADRRRFEALKAREHSTNAPWSPGTAKRIVDDYAAVYDELMARIEPAA